MLIIQHVLFNRGQKGYKEEVRGGFSYIDKNGWGRWGWVGPLPVHCIEAYPPRNPAEGHGSGCAIGQEWGLISSHLILNFESHLTILIALLPFSSKQNGLKNDVR